MHGAGTQVVVRWPGGKEVKYAVASGAQEITVAIDGSIDVAK
jgi:hypothetical protein